MKPIFEKVSGSDYQSFYTEEIVRSSFNDPWHFHPEVEILYIKEGFGTKFVGDNVSPFFPDEIVIVGSNIPHVWSSSSEYLVEKNSMGNKLSCKAICIQFNEKFLGETFLGIPEYNKIKRFLQEARRGIQFGSKIREKLVPHIKGLTRLSGMGKLIELLRILDIMSNSKDYKYLSLPSVWNGTINTSDKDRMATIYEYVIKKFSGKIIFKELASQVNLTPESFCRYFKLRTGKALSAFINEVRIGNGCKMLIEGKYSISQICYASGFNSLSNFNRQFKKIKGLTPSEYKLRYFKEY